jgi:glycine C-acetyltransferase
VYQRTRHDITQELNTIKASGLYKDERIILSGQQASISVSYPPGAPPRQVLNFCSNNYLGLANHPAIINAAREALDSHGFGLSSVRFICGTQDLHKTLERRIAAFYDLDDALLYSSCFDANGGLFESILTADDVIITDALNHASIIDGIRLSKAKRFIYDHADMHALEQRLIQAREGTDVWDHTGLGKEPVPARNILIATDGVFSMDGDVAKLNEIVDLANRYDALVMVDESHATGFFGRTGRGAIEYCGVMGQIDIVTSTLGKAMGGALGGFTAGRREVVDLLRQRSRPYLFSNSLSPSIVAAAIKAFDLVEAGDSLRAQLTRNTERFRTGMSELGFDIVEGVHPIVPVLFRKFDHDARLAGSMAKALYDEGIYVVGFSFPVVPRGQARIRVQLSAAHTTEHIDTCLDAFARVGRSLAVIA